MNTAKTPAAASGQWVMALPRITARERNLEWLADLSRALQARDRRVSWAVPASAAQLSAPAGVPVYPAFDLTDLHDISGPHADAVLHNVDGPRPWADRMRHVWGAFRLGGGDTCLVPNARLADLQSLWSLYATTDLARAPLTVLRITEFFPVDAPRRMGLAELLRALRWVAYRLGTLDVLGKKVLLWPGSELIAALLGEAGLPCLPVWQAQPVRPAMAALMAFPVASDEVATLSDQLRELDPNLRTDVFGAGLRGELPALAAVASPVAQMYRAAVLDAEQLPLVARADLQVPAERCLLVGTGAVGALAQCARLQQARAWGEALLAEPVPDTLALPRAIPATTLAEELLAQADAAQADTARPLPVVVHIAPGWAGAGSSHVFATQLQWLHEQQLPTICLHLDTDDLEANQQLGQLPSRLSALPGGEAVQRWFLTRPASAKALERDTGVPSAYDRLSLEGEERISRQVAIPDSLHQFLRHREVRFVLLNYGHNWPIVERLGLERLPVLMETHDVRPIQHGLYNNEPLVSSAVDVELGMFARASTTVFINEAERQHFSRTYPAAHAHAAFPFQDELAPQPVRSVFETRATSILSAGGVPFDLADQLLTPREQRAGRVAVFVGSVHKANVVSLEWFLSQVYPLGLMDPRLTVLVVGNIKDTLGAVNLPNVVFAGRVHELNSIYEAADLILLPIRTGTGLPIKSVDALTVGAPFVATTPAIQAIPGLAEAVGVADTAPAFAQRVRELLLDDAAATALRQTLAQLKAEDANWQGYAQGWNRIAGLEEADRHGRLAGPRRLANAPQPQQPAGPRNGEFYFWRGHGLEELVGVEPQDGRLSVRGDYARLGLGCWVGSTEARTLELSFQITGPAWRRCLVALDGQLQGRIVLPDAYQPATVHLRVPVSEVGTLQHLSLELRCEDGQGVTLDRLVVRPLAH